MRIEPIETGHFKLDGGAMFGIVPRRMWERMNPPDDRNLCDWAMRCLFLELDERRILFDCGIGSKQDARFKSHFEPSEPMLIENLAKIGVTAADVTDVFLSHLHFDHCGGAVERTALGDLVPAFPNALYWTNQRQLDWAKTPNAKEKASFLTENFIPLEEAGLLRFVEPSDRFGSWLPDIDLFFSYGHTEAMMSPIIRAGDRTVVFCADLLPSRWHIGAPYVMAYDIRPLETMAEKAVFLQKAAENSWILFFEHDPKAECATVRAETDGRFVIDKTGRLSDFF